MKKVRKKSFFVSDTMLQMLGELRRRRKAYSPVYQKGRIATGVALVRRGCVTEGPWFTFKITPTGKQVYDFFSERKAANEPN